MSALSSISATLSQLPCLGVGWISRRSRSVAASLGEGFIERPADMGVEVVAGQDHVFSL